MTTSAPPKHFRPQTDRAQKSVIRKINEAERAMIPPGFDAASEGTRSARTLAQVPLAAIDDQHIARRTNRVRAGAASLITDTQDPFAHSQAELQNIRLQVARAEAETRATVRRKAGAAQHTPMTADPYRLDSGLPTLTSAINPTEGLHRVNHVRAQPTASTHHARPFEPIIAPRSHKPRRPKQDLTALSTAALTCMLVLAFGGTLYTVAEPIFQLLPIVGQWIR